MPNYKGMYKKLFNEITDVINKLQNAQQETEQEYIVSSENEEGAILASEKKFKEIKKEGK